MKELNLMLLRNDPSSWSVLNTNSSSRLSIVKFRAVPQSSDVHVNSYPHRGTLEGAGVD